MIWGYKSVWQTLFVEDSSEWKGEIGEDWIWKTMKFEERWGINKCGTKCKGCVLILHSQIWLITES